MRRRTTPDVAAYFKQLISAPELVSNKFEFTMPTVSDPLYPMFITVTCCGRPTSVGQNTAIRIHQHRPNKFSYHSGSLCSNFNQPRNTKARGFTVQKAREGSHQVSAMAANLATSAGFSED